MPEARSFPSIPTKILLPIDFSPSSQAALEMAADLAQHFHAVLHLVNVIPMFPTTSLPDLVPEAEFIRQARAHAERHLTNCLSVLAARGIKYLFVIPPDKHSIYPENLPAWLIGSRPVGCRSKLDQLVDYMRKHSTVEVLDLRPALLAGKKTAPTYLQQDSHWNWYGGFIGCQEVIKALARQTPQLPPLQLEDFDWSNAPAAGGDLARILGLKDWSLAGNLHSFVLCADL